MSVAGVQLAINHIAEDMLALARLILEDDSISVNIKVNRNTLKDSQLKQDLTIAVNNAVGQDPVLKALFNNYVAYIEWDRPPKYGKRPPISALKKWAAKNGIPTDADTLFRISYAIWRDGHRGRPIFATLDKELDGLYMTDWAEELKDALLDNLDNFFND